MPFTAAKINAQLGFEKQPWAEAGRADLLPAGHALGESSLLFEKIEDDAIQKQIEKLHEARRMNELENKHVPEVRAEVHFDDFAKMDIRVATVVAAEVVPKSKKLLKIKLDIGLEERTVLSGIAEHFKPEEIIGRQVLYLANLAPRKMMGMESKGMILMAEDRDGSLSFVQPGKQVWAGATVS